MTPTEVNGMGNPVENPPFPSVRIGTAGWNYKDWYGIVYPEVPGKDFKELDCIVDLFDTVEINSTFYRPANAFMGAAWARRAARNPKFRFTAKLWQRFTHDRKDYTLEEIHQYTQGIDPLARAGMLGAVLIQFPWSFKNDETGKAWLSGLIETFRDYPLVVELRHASWDLDETYESLDKQKVGVATIDQPVIGQSISFKPISAGGIGYIRMHGRNYKTWFAKQKDGASSLRYDYLYSEKEIGEIADTVRSVAEKSKETFVIQNNHPWGQAVANAFQLRSELGQIISHIPLTLIDKFPELRKIKPSAS